MLAQQTVISIGFKIQYSPQVFEIQGQGMKNVTVTYVTHYSIIF